MANDVSYDLTERQSSAFQLLNSDDPMVRLLYGGAKGGGKSWLGCVFVLSWVNRLIKFFEMKESKNPPPLGFMGRKQAVDFRKTTLETFKAVIPSEVYEIKDQAGEIVFYNRAKVFFGGLDDRDTIKKFNSAELAFLFIDQAEETERGEVNVLKASLRFKHNGKQPPYRELYTANPAECWLKDDFIKGEGKDCFYVPALPSDNPHLPDNYIETLEDSFKDDPFLLSAYRDGDWEALAETNTLITDEMLERLRKVDHRHEEVEKRIVACDPSEGGDECVIKVFEDGHEIDQLILHYKDSMKIGAECVMMIRKHDANGFCCDVIGCGRGVYDYVAMQVEESGVQCVPINSAKKAVSKRYFNLRAEMWWEVGRDKILNQKVWPVEDKITRDQLKSVRYSVTDASGCVKLESKDQTKKRLKGRSPDRADCYIYGIWAQKHIEPMSKRKRERYSYQDNAVYPFNHATC